VPGAKSRWRLATGLLVLTVVSACGSRQVRAPVESRTPPLDGDSARYTVYSGETLYAVAFRYGLNVHDLAAWNGIEAPYVIHPGQRLRLAPRPDAVPSSAAPPRVAPPPERGEDGGPALAGHNPPPLAVEPARREEPVPRVQPGPLVDAKTREGLAWEWPAQGRIVRGFDQGGSKGLDIAGKLGTPVRAAAAGRVVYAGSGLAGYGKLIIVKHNNTYLSAYAHNERVLVEEGDSVARGQHIAHMGRSGAQEVKLHFEIRRDGKPVDPLSYLPKRGSRQEDSDA
jgi:lipoprotein NlpD